jgi:hypothetical protein
LTALHGGNRFVCLGETHPQSLTGYRIDVSSGIANEQDTSHLRPANPVRKGAGTPQTRSSSRAIEPVTQLWHPRERVLQVYSLRTEHGHPDDVIIDRGDVQLCVSRVVDLDHGVPWSPVEMLAQSISTRPLGRLLDKT